MSENRSPFSTPSLDEIGLQTDTDKSSRAHDFLQLYERFLSGMRQDSLNILEIGVWEGGSLAMWSRYFTNAKVLGIDINPAARRFATDRIHIEIADQTNLRDITNIAVEHGPFDLVIDDGSHMWEHQITTLRLLLPFVKRDRFYILEDLDTSYGSFTKEYCGRSAQSAADYLKGLTDYVIGDRALDLANEVDPFYRTFSPLVDYITFSKRTSIIKLRA